MILHNTYKQPMPRRRISVCVRGNVLCDVDKLRITHRVRLSLRMGSETRLPFCTDLAKNRAVCLSIKLPPPRSAMSSQMATRLSHDAHTAAVLRETQDIAVTIDGAYKACCFLPPNLNEYWRVIFGRLIHVTAQVDIRLHSAHPVQSAKIIEGASRIMRLPQPLCETDDATEQLERVVADIREKDMRGAKNLHDELRYKEWEHKLVLMALKPRGEGAISTQINASSWVGRIEVHEGTIDEHPQWAALLTDMVSKHKQGVALMAQEANWPSLYSALTAPTTTFHVQSARACTRPSRQPLMELRM